MRRSALASLRGTTIPVPFAETGRALSDRNQTVIAQAGHAQRRMMALFYPPTLLSVPLQTALFRQSKAYYMTGPNLASSSVAVVNVTPTRFLSVM
jgi:hypothetical protein